jgi:protein transport protein SEC61 subunit gamma-like protein
MMKEQWTKLQSFFLQTQRVMRVTRKPTMHEFQTIAKITGLGIAVIGMIGFILQIVKQILFP